MSHIIIAINIEMPKRIPIGAGMGHGSWVAGAVARVGHEGVGTGKTMSVTMSRGRRQVRRSGPTLATMRKVGMTADGEGDRDCWSWA